MNKGTTVAEILTRARTAQGAGHPRRVLHPARLSRRAADGHPRHAPDCSRRHGPDDIGVSVSYPLPGTKFYELVKEQLGGKTHWQDSGDLAMMFRGTYSSEFYRAVRNLLHEQVSVGQLDAAGHVERYHQAKRRLARRWAALQSSESHFRVGRALG